MKTAAIFLLAIGCFWALLVLWFFLNVAGVAEGPESWIKVAVYWGGMLVGPVVLIVGAALVLRAVSSRSGMVLLGIGCLIFTGFVIYNSIAGMQRQPLQVQPAYCTKYPGTSSPVRSGTAKAPQLPVAQWSRLFRRSLLREHNGEMDVSRLEREPGTRPLRGPFRPADSQFVQLRPQQPDEPCRC